MSRNAKHTELIFEDIVIFFENESLISAYQQFSVEEDTEYSIGIKLLFVTKGTAEKSKSIDFVEYLGAEFICAETFEEFIHLAWEGSFQEKLKKIFLKLSPNQARAFQYARIFK